MLSEKHLDDLMDYEAPERFSLLETPDQLLITEEYRAAKRAKSLAKMVKAIADGKEVLFWLDATRGKHAVVRCAPLGIKLARAIERELPELEEHLPGNAFNPYLELLRKSLRDYPQLDVLKPKLQLVPSDLADGVTAQLNALVEAIRREAQTKTFKDELDARRRQCEANKKSGERFFNGVMNRCSKILGIRIDLTCGQESAEVRGITASVSVEQAKQEKQRFLRYVRETYPSLGAMVKFEYGLHTGYHFHVVVLLNGHLKDSDVWIAQQMGEHWVNCITEGRGRYFNCNAQDYWCPAVGMIHRRDLIKRKAFVEKVIGYLTKSDFWVKFDGVKKTFTKTPMNKHSMKEGGADAGGRS